jgi:hypothetical protein
MRLTIFSLAVLSVVFVGTAAAQRRPATGSTNVEVPTAAAFSSSPAFAEVKLRETEIEAELESLLMDYTEDYPKIKELRFALTALRAEMDRIRKASSNASRMTTALGKLVVRKIDTLVDLWKLEQTLADAHPDVKRAKKKVEIYEKAIKEILG